VARDKPPEEEERVFLSFALIVKLTVVIVNIFTRSPGQQTQQQSSFLVIKDENDRKQLEGFKLLTGVRNF